MHSLASILIPHWVLCLEAPRRRVRSRSGNPATCCLRSPTTSNHRPRKLRGRLLLKANERRQTSGTPLRVPLFSFCVKGSRGDSAVPPHVPSHTRERLPRPRSPSLAARLLGAPIQEQDCRPALSRRRSRCHGCSSIPRVCPETASAPDPGPRCDGSADLWFPPGARR